MLLARTGGQTLASPGFWVLAGVTLIVTGLFIRLIVFVVDAVDPDRWGGRWTVSRRGWARFQYGLGILLLVGGLVALAVTGRFFVG